MNILILEDEPQAAQRLERMVTEIDPSVHVVAMLDSVKKSVKWFKENTAPDVVLMDIQLADGISFEIFDQVEITCPVIFTTAYDEFALKAFKVNSVDYILKPFDKEELSAAFKKLSHVSGRSQQEVLESINQAMNLLTKRFKTRFVIKVGEHLRTIEVDSVRYFYSHEKTTFCVTDDQRQFVLDYTLEQLENLIDPDGYYRVNRKYLISAKAIQDIISYSNSRLKLVLKGSKDNDIIVARERVQDFKQWLDR